MLNNNININIPLIPLNGTLPTLSKLYVEYFENLYLLRLDEIHPVLAGNKWFKIKNAIAYCLQNNLKGIISFGGNYSNHLHALSHACGIYNLQSIGIINGQKIALLNTPTLMDAKQYGMQLYLGGFDAYKKNTSDLALLLPSINILDYYIMPMGGNDALSILGAEEIYSFIPSDTEDIWVSAGSGTTALAISKRLKVGQKLHIVTPFKKNDMLHLLFNKPNVDIHYFNLAGKFGAENDIMRAYLNAFYVKHGIALDIVYTVNLMCFIEQFYTTKTLNKIVAIHTGGVQGNRSLA